MFYRYFLPFLTEKDIQRIHNGIYMFLNSMRVAKQSPFCLEYVTKGKSNQCATISDDKVREIVKMIPNKVTGFLERFKGVEAFYKVEVQNWKDDKNDPENLRDMRTTTKVEMLNVDEGGINYFIFSMP